MESPIQYRTGRDMAEEVEEVPSVETMAEVLYQPQQPAERPVRQPHGLPRKSTHR